MKCIPVWSYFLRFCGFKRMKDYDGEAKAQRKEERNMLARKEKDMFSVAG